MAEGGDTPTFLPARARATLVTAGRQVVGVVVGGVIGAALWLIISQEGRNFGYTDLDFARGVALTAGADGVNRQEVGSRGLEATLALGVALMLVYALAAPLLRGRLGVGWWPRAGLLGVATFLLWGLVFSPARPSGILGLEAGGLSSMLLFMVASAAFAIVGVRVHTLIVGDEWWRPKEGLLEQGLQELAAQRDSLELPKERGEKGGVRPGG